MLGGVVQTIPCQLLVLNAFLLDAEVGLEFDAVDVRLEELSFPLGKRRFILVDPVELGENVAEAAISYFVVVDLRHILKDEIGALDVIDVYDFQEVSRN